MREPNLETLWKNGSKAWANVPDASQWVDEIRGNVDEKNETMSETPKCPHCGSAVSSVSGARIFFKCGSYSTTPTNDYTSDLCDVLRELNAANERIKQLEAELESYRSWNMALRKVGDDMDYRLTLHASREPVLKKWKAIRNGNPNDDGSATS
jgi:hypothetical protein